MSRKILKNCYSRTGVVLQRIIQTKERQTEKEIIKLNSRKEKESNSVETISHFSTHSRVHSATNLPRWREKIRAAKKSCGRRKRVAGGDGRQGKRRVVGERQANDDGVGDGVACESGVATPGVGVDLARAVPSASCAENNGVVGVLRSNGEHGTPPTASAAPVRTSSKSDRGEAAKRSLLRAPRRVARCRADSPSGTIAVYPHRGRTASATGHRHAIAGLAPPRYTLCRTGPGREASSGATLPGGKATAWSTRLAQDEGVRKSENGGRKEWGTETARGAAGESRDDTDRREMVYMM